MTIHSSEGALLAAFDGHHFDGIRRALEAGANACAPVRGKRPIFWLLEEYGRSDRLPQCLKLLLDRGATLEDPIVTAVLCNDTAAIADLTKADPKSIDRRVTLVSAFCSLSRVSLLHLAAEYGYVDAARALIEAGADVNAAADLDEYGFNGHTPIFHTVNSNANRSAPIMCLLLDAGARADVRLAGLTWGKGYEWETTFFDVTPISFAQMGLLPQVHRDERDIYANIHVMLEYLQRPVPPLINVPNRYLLPGGHG